jgi:hypothetical protein
MKNRILITGVMLLLCLSGSAFANGLNVYFNASSINDRFGNALTATDYHNYQARLEFFTADPGSPKLSTTRLANAEIQPLYTSVGGIIKYGLTELDGGNLYVRVWKDALSGDRKGNYYGVYHNAVAAGSTPAYDWPTVDGQVVSLVTDHKADVPYQPSIDKTKIEESMVRSGINQVLKLVIPLSYDSAGGAAGDGIRETQSYALWVKYPNGSEETRGGSSITLDNTAAGHYLFKPIAFNWYGSIEGAIVDYDTLGGAAAAAAGGVLPELTVDLTPPASDTNIIPTSLCLPSLSLTKPKVTTLTDAVSLANLINDANNDIIVAAICWGDPKTSTVYSALFDTYGKLIAGSDNFNLQVRVPVQIYIYKAGTLTIQ